MRFAMKHIRRPEVAGCSVTTSSLETMLLLVMRGGWDSGAVVPLVVATEHS